MRGPAMEHASPIAARGSRTVLRGRKDSCRSTGGNRVSYHQRVRCVARAADLKILTVLREPAPQLVDPGLGIGVDVAKPGIVTASRLPPKGYERGLSR